MNKEDLLKENNINRELVDLTEIAMNRATDMIVKLFMKELSLNGNKSAQAFMIGCVTGPITFVMNIMQTMHELGIDPSKEFPNFMLSYKNYAEELGNLQDIWGTLPFNEFRDKFIATYSKKHFIWDL